MNTRGETTEADVETAGRADIETLSQVIAAAFMELPPSQWLIPDPVSRRDIFPHYFRIFVEHAVSTGVVLTTPDRTAAALWLPAGLQGPRPPADYAARLALVTGPWLTRFEVFDFALDRAHPTSLTHCHLAMLAVHPAQQRCGIGTSLLNAHHKVLDQGGIPAYLEASDLAKRRIYHLHGYEDYGRPIQLPDGGPEMFPMVRRAKPRNPSESARRRADMT